MRSSPSRVAPIFCSAPLPRPLATAERASSRWMPTSPNAKPRTSFAAAWNMPVPQNAEPMAKPHSAMSKPAPSVRIWMMPIACSKPCGTTPKQM